MDVCGSFVSLFDLSVFIEVVVRNVASFGFFAACGVSQRRLCEDHFRVRWFFGACSGRKVVQLVLRVST